MSRATRRNRKPFTVSLVLTWKEFNYVRQSLWVNILDLRKDVERWGKNHGNTDHLLRFSEKTHKRLQREYDRQFRVYLGDAGYKRQRKYINELIANSRAALRKGR